MMVEDCENNVHVEAFIDSDNPFAFVQTTENDIGRSVELKSEEMKQVADMLYAIAEKMEDKES